MNDHLLPVPNGAPLRLRVERQLGYKQAKYVQRIEAVESLAGIYGGKGGYWEDKRLRMVRGDLIRRAQPPLDHARRGPGCNVISAFTYGDDGRGACRAGSCLTHRKAPKL